MGLRSNIGASMTLGPLSSDRAVIRRYVSRLRQRRQEQGLCIYDARDRGRDPHGPPVHGQLCEVCYQKTRERQRKHREARRRARGE